MKVESIKETFSCLKENEHAQKSWLPTAGNYKIYEADSDSDYPSRIIYIGRLWHKFVTNFNVQHFMHYI